jgi:hypothetical protein
MANKYSLYGGKFPCHTCKEVVPSIRFYPEKKEVTWMCGQKHVSMVSLVITKKKKKDYEREIRD